MAFWTEIDFNAIHPKVKSKFILAIGGFSNITVKSVTKPSATLETKQMRMINHFYNYPGLVKWEPITITFIDMYGEAAAGQGAILGQPRDGGLPVRDTSTNTAAYLTRLLNDTGYLNHDGKPIDLNAAGYDGEALVTNIMTPSKAATIDVAFDTSFKIQQIDSSGIIVEQWNLINPIIQKIEWGSLSYGDDNLVEYKLTVTYDYANFSSKPEAAETSSPQPIYDDIIREERNAKIEAFQEMQKKKEADAQLADDFVSGLNFDTTATEGSLTGLGEIIPPSSPVVGTAASSPLVIEGLTGTSGENTTLGKTEEQLEAERLGIAVEDLYGD